MTCGSRCPTKPWLTCDLSHGHADSLHAAWRMGACTTWDDGPEAELPLGYGPRPFTADDPDAP